MWVFVNFVIVNLAAIDQKYMIKFIRTFLSVFWARVDGQKGWVGKKRLDREWKSEESAVCDDQENVIRIMHLSQKKSVEIGVVRSE